ncbi:hypothetical protein WMY93_025581 [Mugilogobius chulae]|uniref:Fucolectin tachylectin-4 pentraxin-1 domain-containing protein n=1 Tax=Mugilogobius chulae TaxID=88201 RepID=A0AAW0MZA8_9GOBI
MSQCFDENWWPLPPVNVQSLTHSDQTGLCDIGKVEKNVALRGKATQSDRYDSDFGAAYNAIDGNRESDYAAGSCAVTEQQTNPWWRVDLLNTYIVTSITVTNRRDCCPERLDGAEIHVGSSLINNGDDNPVVAVLPHIPAGRSLTINFSSRVQGRYVSVVLPGTGRLLTICEVEVYGYYAPTGENLALQGKATQSSLHGTEIAYNAIDGNRGTDWSTCSHTKANLNPWCAVISSIPPGFTQGFDCNGMDGRYVTIVIPARTEYLHVCEVEVYGSVLD